MARQVTIFITLTASFNMFKKGWGGPGRGLTTSSVSSVTSSELKCHQDNPVSSVTSGN